MGIVLTGAIETEDRHDGVTDELLDGAPFVFDRRPPVREVAVHHLAGVLGVKHLGDNGEVDEVGEKHGYELALLPARPFRQSVALLQERLEGDVDDGVAQHCPLVLEGGNCLLKRVELACHEIARSIRPGRVIGGGGEPHASGWDNTSMTSEALFHIDVPLDLRRTLRPCLLYTSPSPR